MTRWIGGGLAFILALTVIVSLSGGVIGAGPPVAGDDDFATLPCGHIITASARNDIRSAQARLRALQPGDRQAFARELQRYDAVLRCQAARNPTDGRIFALLAWTAWRTGAPVDRITALVGHSYRLHPFEIDTIAVRHLVVAANWARLDEDTQTIGRADQKFRLGSRSIGWIIPELAVLYAEAGTSSDLYFEALDWLGRLGPEHVRALETKLIEIARAPARSSAAPRPR